VRIVLDTNVLVSAFLSAEGAPAQLVTGNARHFPESLGVVVLSPRAPLQRLEAEQ